MYRRHSRSALNILQAKPNCVDQCALDGLTGRFDGDLSSEENIHLIPALSHIAAADSNCGRGVVLSKRVADDRAAFLFSKSLLGRENHT